jgi:four helix bundle protein
MSQDHSDPELELPPAPPASGDLHPRLADSPSAMEPPVEDSPRDDQADYAPRGERRDDGRPRDREHERGRGRRGDRRDRGDRGRQDQGERQDRGERPMSFEQLRVWQEAHQLALKVFAATPQLPESQQAGLAMQMEQAAVEAPKCIAQGFRRRGANEKARFYLAAQTALAGLRYYLILCRDLGFTIEYNALAERTETVTRMLDGLLRSTFRQ